MRRMLILAFLALLAGCTSAPQADVSAGLGEEFTLKVNQSAYVDGMLIMFAGVEEDSRCPSDVICVWEGEAVVEIKGSKSGESGPFMDITISTQERSEDFSFEGRTYSIELVRLEPYPSLDDPAEPGEYAATLKVTSS